MRVVSDKQSDNEFKSEVEAEEAMKDENGEVLSNDNGIYHYVGCMIKVSQLYGCNIHRNDKPITVKGFIFLIYCIMLSLFHLIMTGRLFFIFEKGEVYGSNLFQRVMIVSIFIMGFLQNFVGIFRWSKIMAFFDEYNQITDNNVKHFSRNIKYICLFQAWNVCLVCVYIPVSLGYVLFSNIHDTGVLQMASPWNSRISQVYVVFSLSLISFTILSAGTVATLHFYHIVVYIIYKEFSVFNHFLEETIQTDEINFIKTRRKHHQLCSLIKTADGVFSGRYHSLTGIIIYQ